MASSNCRHSSLLTKKGRAWPHTPTRPARTKEKSVRLNLISAVNALNSRSSRTSRLAKSPAHLTAIERDDHEESYRLVYRHLRLSFHWMRNCGGWRDGHGCDGHHRTHDRSCLRPQHRRYGLWHR